MTARGSFKQHDLTRAIRAAEAAGIKPYRIEIDDNGKPVVIVTGHPASAGPEETPENLKDLL
jgi:hypothetical protein